MPAVPNEFGPASNTADTIAMAAVTSGNARKQRLRPVLLQPELPTIRAASIPKSSPSSATLRTLLRWRLWVRWPRRRSRTKAAVPRRTAANPTVDLSDIPLTNYSGTNFPSDAASSNFMVINSITINNQDEFLTYSATSSDPTLVTPTIGNEWLLRSITAAAKPKPRHDHRHRDRPLRRHGHSKFHGKRQLPRRPSSMRSPSPRTTTRTSTTLTATPSSTDAGRFAGELRPTNGWKDGGDGHNRGHRRRR